MTEFTPFAAILGGSLIGIASLLLMLGFGRIMGATGVLTGVLLPESKSDWVWRAVLIAGMATAPLLFLGFTGQFPPIDVPVSNAMLIFGGVLVGIGVTFGGGCTSGHGVCGISRFSPRSIVATVVFMISTAITVFVVRHVLGL